MEHPPSINRLYGLAVKRVRGQPVPYKYMTKEGKTYLKTALQTLHYEYAWKPYGPGDYFVLVDLVVSSKSTDIDNVNKILIDAIKEAIGIDDRYFLALPSIRIPVKTIAEQGVQVIVDVVQTKKKEQLSRRMAQSHLYHEWLREHE